MTRHADLIKEAMELPNDGGHLSGKVTGIHGSEAKVELTATGEGEFIQARSDFDYGAFPLVILLKVIYL